jgi:hypothetical protein
MISFPVKLTGNPDGKTAAGATLHAVEDQAQDITKLIHNFNYFRTALYI